MSLKRVQHWPVLLDAYLRRAQELSFVWGEHDCCLFVSGWINICTGVDPAESWRGKYKSLPSALHLAGVRDCYNLGDIAQKAATQYGIPSCLPKMAGRGDIVLFKSNTFEGIGHTLGIVDTNLIYSPGIECLQTVPLANVWNSAQTKAWKIG